MEQLPLPQLPPQQVTIIDGVLRSTAFNDVYFSAENGLEESRFVFLEGTGILEKLDQTSQITVAETGFGTGLNLLALCHALSHRKSACKIDYISFEAAPLTPGEVRLAHSAFPEIALLSEQLLAQWPRRWHGVHRLSMLNGQVTIHLHYGQAEQVMPRLDFAADIWFLDGFSPAKNPELWTKSIALQIARLSAFQARLATFTVARMVREALSEAGFGVEKSSGFGRKREMLKGMFEKGFNREKKAPAQKVAIIGGGVAGAAMAHALAELAIDHIVLEKEDRLAYAASGNPMGILVPFLSVGDMLAARLSISALADARQFADRHNLIQHSGVISLDFNDRKALRQAKLATQGFPADLARYVSASEAYQLCGLETGMGGIYHAAGGVISPLAYCQALSANSPVITGAEVRAVTGTEGDWQITCMSKKTYSASHIIYCGGAATPDLAGADILPGQAFQITSGQLSYMPLTSPLSELKMALNYSGYLLPAQQGMQISGAGFDHNRSTMLTLAGHQHNLDLMPDRLREYCTNPAGFSGRRSLRLAVEDRLPVAGAFSPTRYMLGALGARGLTLAGFLAHSLASRLASRPDFLDQKMAAALHPARLNNL